MAKAKSSNPVEAHRKAARAREAARNKAQRQKVREDKAVRSDTRALEAEIRELERKGASLTAAQQKELDDLRGELKKVRALKEAFVALHPESKGLVLPDRTAADKQEESSKTVQGFDATAAASGLVNGRVPQRSIYYDAVFNPTGAPPPGMPYREKPMSEWATSSQPPLPPGPPPPNSFLDSAMSDVSHGEATDSSSSSSSDDEGDGIMLPSGAPPPRPASSSSSSDDEDGIVMPAGPPPLPPGPPPSAASTIYTGPPPSFAPPVPPPNMYARPPPPIPYPGPPPPSLAGGMYAGPPPGFAPPPPQFAPAPYAYNARPPGAFYAPPQGAQFPADSLAQPGQSGTTYQAWHSRPRPPRPQPQPPLNAPTGPSSARPPSSSSAPAATTTTAAPAVISAAPQLRDLAKEATTFVPPALRKKQAAERARAALGGLKGGVAPANRTEGEEGEEDRVRKPDLLAALQPGLKGMAAGAGEKGKGKTKDDYEKFLSDVGDLL